MGRLYSPAILAGVPLADVAHSTNDVNWDDIELRVFSTDGQRASGRIALPDGQVHELELTAADVGDRFQSDPLGGDVRWQITSARE